MIVYIVIGYDYGEPASIDSVYLVKDKANERVYRLNQGKNGMVYEVQEEEVIE